MQQSQHYLKETGNNSATGQHHSKAILGLISTAGPVLAMNSSRTDSILHKALLLTHKDETVKEPRHRESKRERVRERE